MYYEYLPSYKDDLYLSHHGVKGMKWGVRRYQNKDGSLTKAGKQHRIRNGIKNIKKNVKNKWDSLSPTTKAAIRLAGYIAARYAIYTATKMAVNAAAKAANNYVRDNYKDFYDNFTNSSSNNGYSSRYSNTSSDRGYSSRYSNTSSDRGNSSRYSNTSSDSWYRYSKKTTTSYTEKKERGKKIAEDLLNKNKDAKFSQKDVDAIRERMRKYRARAAEEDRNGGITLETKTKWEDAFDALRYAREHMEDE